MFVHIEAPDEAGHEGKAEEKIRSIEQIDREAVGQFRRQQGLRLLILPDHPTPVKLRTHAADPVPFLIWGHGIRPNGAQAFCEPEAQRTGLFLEGYELLQLLLKS